MENHLSRIKSCAPQIAACLLPVRFVEAQKRRSSPRDFRGRNDATALGTKVVSPHICPRIKQTNDMFCFRVHRGNIGSLEAVALDTRQRKILKRGFSTVLGSDDMIRFVNEKRADLGHLAVFAAITSSFPNSRPDRSGNARLAHARPGCCANTSALISDTNRSMSQISSSSASSAGVRFPAWLRRSNSWARAAAGSDGWKPIISLAAGRRAKNEITSRRKPEFRVQVRRSPRARMSATRSPSGSNCRANCSGISMVTCMTQSLRHNTQQVKLRILASAHISSFVIRH